ncbi:MAG TPA: xanthine dehydrogenase family protein subunit M [Firmicutes bacterium]|nr:xanthine dehydrogenase family protein subunit M [Bacillota bacterium]
MPAFTYRKCSDLSQAMKWLSEEDAFLLAGGTDLLVGIRGGKFKARQVLDIKDIAELKVLQEDEDGIVIGAGVTLNQIALFDPVRKNVPVLAEGCHSIGTYSVRNRATLVGNICNASPAADTAAPLYCLGAEVKIAGPEGERRLPIEEFFTGPGKTALQPGELVTAVIIPKPYPQGKGVYKKASRTRSVDLATVGVAVQRCGQEVRIALGAVAPTPIRAKSVEKAINQDKVADLAQAAKLVRNDISPITDLRGSRDYRYHIAEVLVRRGLEETREV